MNNFKVMEKLGEGTFSVVHKVLRKSDDKLYALKKMRLSVLSAKQIANCLNEIRLLASLNHSNIIAYKEAFYDQTSNTLCVITEFAEEGDLYSKIKSKIKKGQFFEQIQIWKILIQSLRGLDYLHSMKILHRDIKSANIFVSEGVVKIGDLNVSIVSKDGLARTQAGTPFYCSPQIWNNNKYNSKSDIYSLGCVLYELAALRPPYQATKMNELSQKVLKGNLQRIPSRYSEDLATLIRQCLSLKPNDRPSCHSLLKSSILRAKIQQLQCYQSLENKFDQQLLQTIRPPRFLRMLKDRLPTSNYQSRPKASSLKRQRNSLQRRNQTEVSDCLKTERHERASSAIGREILLVKKDSRPELGERCPLPRILRG